MKTLFPSYVVFSLVLLVVQTYLLVYGSLFLLRRMKLLKRPYDGMEYAESLLAGIVLLGMLAISSADAPGIFQAAKAYSDGHPSMGTLTLLFVARSFLVVLFFCLLYVGLNYINIRFLFRGYYRSPSLPVSMLLCAMGVGLAVICWLICKEIVDNMTPRFVNFQ